MDIQNTISKLKFIGSIKPDEKININDLTMQPNTFLTSIIRTFFKRDNRKKTLEFIKSNIEKSFQIIVYFKNDEKNQRNFQNVINDLKKSMDGIQNLKATYSKDSKFNCDLDVILQNIETELLKYDLTLHKNKKKTV